MTPDLVRLVRRLCVPVVALTGALVVVGLALHQWPAPEWPYTAHGNWRRFARGVEALGTAAVAVPPVVLIVAGMRVGFRRWREGIFLLTAVVIAGLALIVASAAVPGTSFPAAAAGLAAATYGGLSVVLSRRLRTPGRRTIGGIAPWTVVFGVAVAQVYLGEFRVEVIAASAVAGVVSVGIATRYVLLGGSFEQRPAIDDIPLPDRRRAAVIVNPTKVADMDEERRAVTAYLAAAGWHQPWWLETRLDELGHGHAKAAADGGADVVFACGGDGTIMSVLSGLAGTGVPLAILPAGTGNLLARNLQLPPDRDACLRIGLGGVDRKIDVGRVDENHRFAVMAGMGLDAAMIMDAPERLKRRIGWPAYAISVTKHLFDRRAHVAITIDDAEPVELRARGIVIGNVGKLQAGMVLMPEAEPDDGVLDVAVLVPKSIRQWLMLGFHVASRRPTARGSRIKHFRGRRIHIECDRVWPREIDGDLLEPSQEMTIVVEPKALIVRIPPGTDAMT